MLVRARVASRQHPSFIRTLQSFIPSCLIHAQKASASRMLVLPILMQNRQTWASQRLNDASAFSVSISHLTRVLRYACSASKWLELNSKPSGLAMYTETLDDVSISLLCQNTNAMCLNGFKFNPFKLVSAGRHSCLPWTSTFQNWQSWNGNTVRLFRKK